MSKLMSICRRNLATQRLILGLVIAFECAMALSAQQTAVNLKVAAVQFRSSADLADNLKRMGETLASLAAEHVRVAVFPECALTSYIDEAIKKHKQEDIAAAETEMQRICRKNGIAAIFGSVYKVNGRTYDTALVIDSHGELLDRYGKVYLAGEKWATPGNHISYFELDGIPSTVMICHDERYPEMVRLPAIQGARVVYYISHESPLTQESKLPGYRAQLMARAVENGVYLVASNAPASPKDLSGSHGQSRIVSPDGNVMAEASFFGEDILREALNLRPGNMQRPLTELLGAWWKQGVAWMMENRHRTLE